MWAARILISLYRKILFDKTVCKNYKLIQNKLERTFNCILIPVLKTPMLSTQWNCNKKENQCAQIYYQNSCSKITVGLRA